MIKIVQIMPTISYGDAVSNDALCLMKIIKYMGFKTEIYAENISDKVKKYAKNISKYRPDEKDIVIYHFSTGSEIINLIRRLKVYKKIIKYHNITPDKYFKNYNVNLQRLVKDGREQLKKAYDIFDYSLGDSDYNCKELEEYGFKNIEILPVLIPFNDYNRRPSDKITRKFDDNYTNVLFVGRIAPNKKQEDIIKTFYYYKKYIDKESRLFLVGSYQGMEEYYDTLKKLVEKLELKDVYFTGHIPFDEIIAYYSIADLFLCMSEHEGFCVPLIESMLYKVPILAYNSSAIENTLGRSGILLNNNSYYDIAEFMYKLKEDSELRKKIISAQEERLKFFSEENTSKKFKRIILDVIRG